VKNTATQGTNEGDGVEIDFELAWRWQNPKP